MKFNFLLFFVILISCQSDNLKEKDYSKQINLVKSHAKNNNYNQDIALMIDYSIHSGLPRFFIVNLQKNKITDKALVCHGKGKDNHANSMAKAINFSNVNNSNCTSLGFALIGERAYSKWGKNYKYWLNGLEKSNNNMKKRVVVLHAWEGVPNFKTYPLPIANSLGCPTVSIDFLDTLDSILKKEKKVLLYSFK